MYSTLALIRPCRYFDINVVLNIFIRAYSAQRNLVTPQKVWAFVIQNGSQILRNMIRCLNVSTINTICSYAE